MTVATEVSDVEYVGNGVTTAFPTGFKFLENDHLVVKLTPSGGVESIKTEGVHYTVTGAGLDVGGTVTMLVAPGAGDALVIEREVPLTQDTSFITQGSFAPKVHEKEFDKSVMIDQQLDRRISALENAGTTNTALAGDGLSISGGTTWHVGAGNGIQANADTVEVLYGSVADLADVTKAAESAGVLNKAARSDHKHDISTAAPAAGAVAIGNAAAEGAATSLARSDHTHAVAAGVPVSIAAANAAGAAATFARSDHVHNHGNQAGGALHSLATTGAHGFMSSVDKTKLNALLEENVAESYNTTSDAAPTVLTSRTPADGTVETIEATIAARAITGDYGAGYKLVGTFRRVGGATTQVGATTVVHSAEDRAAWAATLSISGTIVRVLVTGEAAMDIEWVCIMRIITSPP